MATKNTIQVNGFSKGMQTDISDSLIDNDAYSMANNLRYITDQDNNSGELHMIKGAVIAFSSNNYGQSVIVTPEPDQPTPDPTPDPNPNTDNTDPNTNVGTIDQDIQNKEEQFQAIDLGLTSKTRWANMNFGASKSYEYGNYMAWGDPTGNNQSFKSTDYPSIPTNNTVISRSEFDCAYMKYGDRWQMPDQRAWIELQNECTWLYTRVNDVLGYLITGKNGNSIFLPAAGYKNMNNTHTAWVGQDVGKYQYYWTGEGNAPSYIGQVGLYEFVVPGNKTLTPDYANIMVHMPMRPVYVPPMNDTYNGKIEGGVDLGLLPVYGKRIIVAEKNIGANTFRDYGTFYSWAETSPKDNYSLSTYKYQNNGVIYTPENLKSIAGTQYDVARQTLGGQWQMPTIDDIIALFYYCTVEYVEDSKTIKLTGPNGNSVYFPLPGYKNGTGQYYNDVSGRYWTSTNYTREPTYYDKRAHTLELGVPINGNEQLSSTATIDKTIGAVVRPVMILDE